MAPNDRELLEGFGITNRTYRTKLVAWMLTVLKRQAAEEAAGGLQTPRFAGQYLQKRTGTGGSVTPRAASRLPYAERYTVAALNGVPTAYINSKDRRKLTTSTHEELCYTERLRCQPPDLRACPDRVGAPCCGVCVAVCFGDGTPNLL